MYFAAAVLLAVLRSKKLLKIVTVTLVVSRFSLSITTDRKKIIMRFSYHNVMEMRSKLEEREIFTLKILW